MASTRPRRDYDDWGPVFLGIGTVHNVAEAVASAPSSSTPVLWIPDPDKATGWREFYCTKPGSPAPVRPIGFRKPGA